MNLETVNVVENAGKPQPLFSRVRSSSRCYHEVTTSSRSPTMYKPPCLHALETCKSSIQSSTSPVRWQNYHGTHTLHKYAESTCNCGRRRTSSCLQDMQFLDGSGLRPPALEAGSCSRLRRLRPAPLGTPVLQDVRSRSLQAAIASPLATVAPVSDLLTVARWFSIA